MGAERRRRTVATYQARPGCHAGRMRGAQPLHGVATRRSLVSVAGTRRRPFRARSALAENLYRLSCLLATAGALARGRGRQKRGLKPVSSEAPRDRVVLVLTKPRGRARSYRAAIITVRRRAS